MNITYFVSFYYNKENEQGFSYCTITLEEPISSTDHIANVVKEIKKTGNYKTVALISYQVLSEAKGFLLA